jgi:hypothetical protein
MLLFWLEEFRRAILGAFPPRRSGCVRSAKTTGDKNLLAVWRDIAVGHIRLPFL